MLYNYATVIMSWQSGGNTESWSEVLFEADPLSIDVSTNCLHGQSLYTKRPSTKLAQHYSASEYQSLRWCCWQSMQPNVTAIDSQLSNTNCLKLKLQLYTDICMPCPNEQKHWCAEAMVAARGHHHTDPPLHATEQVFDEMTEANWEVTAS